MLLSVSNVLTRAAIGRGKAVTIYGLGFGQISPHQSDDRPPSAAVYMAQKPAVVMGTSQLTEAQILYAGLTPGYVGLFQLNLIVPNAVATGAAVPLVMQVDSIPSNQNSSGSRISTTISVKH